MAEPEPGVAGPSPAGSRPLTGAEYLESLRDDREIYLYGERVKDVTAHPAFRNPARMVARLYDALHDPAHQGRAHLRRPTPAAAATPTGSSPRRTAPRTWSPTSRRSPRGRG